MTDFMTPAHYILEDGKKRCCGIKRLSVADTN